ncbi:putative methyltransferase domain-containing protein [Diaporthe ampelina]|uniref:Putative methyltransferase domain-containing protein n=1 Tax=Diaporthe ampelina TaxID=1214573 RepID=A0A0G2FP85_9PEZI|nr:putative methyltransferase domain-containing protein [Diaporthe ampelina]
MHRISKSYKRYGFIPNTQQEQDRNVLQHEIIKELFDGRFHLAPARRPKTVLDIGTGPGIWALEFAQQNPRSSVLGIDLEPVKPPYLVSNCHFQIRDATEDWDLNTTFDFVHARMLGDLPEKQRLVQAVYDNLNPGGWAEFTEWIVLLQSPNHSFENTSFHKWNKLMSRGKFLPQAVTSFANSDFIGLKDLGSSLYYPTQYKPLLEKAGFENITVTKYGAPTNACYPGKKLQKIGTMMTKNWSTIIEPLTLSVFIDGLGWSADDVKKFLLNVKREIPDTRYHSFMTL